MPHTKHEIAQEIMNQAISSPKTNAAIGASVVAVGGVSSNDIAIWLGIIIGVFSLYNQVMVAIRSRRDKKLERARKAFEFKKQNPNAPEDLF